MNALTTVAALGNSFCDYIDEDGRAWLNAEDVAHAWGFTDTKDGVEYVR